MMDIMTHKTDTLQLMHVWTIAKYGALVIAMDFAPEMVAIILSTDEGVTRMPTSTFMVTIIGSASIKKAIIK